MLKKIFAFKFFILTIITLHSPAWALDFQLGVGALDISKSDETTKESTFFPFVGLGFGLNSGLSMVLEVGTLGYETSVTGDEDLAQGSLSTTGTSTALIIAPQTENLIFRLGYGTILYKYNFEMDSGWNDIFESLGWDVTQKLDDANGTQIILGVDAKADPFFLGVEYRQISVKPKATIGIKIPSENIDLETTNEVDLSHTWTGIRLGLNF